MFHRWLTGLHIQKAFVSIRLMMNQRNLALNCMLVSSTVNKMKIRISVFQLLSDTMDGLHTHNRNLLIYYMQMSFPDVSRYIPIKSRSIFID